MSFIPWQALDWLESVQTWLETEFLNITPLQEIHAWAGAYCGSCLWRGQKLFFKAVPPALAREITVTRLLNQFSSAVPQVLAFDLQRHWLVTRSVGDTHLIHDSNPEHWQAALRCMAELQIKTLSQHTALLEAGCAVQIPETALVQARAVLERSMDEHAPRALQTLATVQFEGLDLLPLALAHGDFHPMNIIAPNSLIDWSDALIAHPFVDLERFLRWIMGSATPHHWSPFADTRALEPSFMAAYLEPWSDFVPFERLQAVFRATRPFGLVVLLAQHHSGQGRSLEAFYMRLLARFSS